MPQIQNSIKIKAPYEIVFDMTNDIENWPNLFTEYKEAKILYYRQGYVLFQLTTHPDQNQTSRSWISERYFSKKEKRVIARRIYPLLPFKEMNIEWSYTSENGITEMVWIQRFEVDPAAGFTEEQVINHLNKTSVEQLAAIKANIERAVGELR